MTNKPPERNGAIGVIVRHDGQYLVIERAAHVRAPGRLCFPGGAIEDGESESQAVVRELWEELSLAVQPIRRLWKSQTNTGLTLYWWLVEPIDADVLPIPNPHEVESWSWMTAEVMEQHPKTLPTNREFLSAIRNGTIAIIRHE